MTLFSVLDSVVPCEITDLILSHFIGGYLFNPECAGRIYHLLELSQTLMHLVETGVLEYLCGSPKSFNQMFRIIGSDPVKLPSQVLLHSQFYYASNRSKCILVTPDPKPCFFELVWHIRLIHGTVEQRLEALTRIEVSPTTKIKTHLLLFGKLQIYSLGVDMDAFIIWLDHIYAHLQKVPNCLGSHEKALISVNVAVVMFGRLCKQHYRDEDFASLYPHECPYFQEAKDLAYMPSILEVHRLLHDAKLLYYIFP